MVVNTTLELRGRGRKTMRVNNCTKDDLQKARDAVDSGAMIKIITAETIRKCPHFIWAPDHYKEDGSCLCFDLGHQEKLRKERAIRSSKYKQVAMRQKEARHEREE
jgi:hypothetical protein